MHLTVAILFGLLAVPQAFAWPKGFFRNLIGPSALRNDLGGGINPDNVKRHVYTFNEFCPKFPRVLRFGDEVIVMSERPWQSHYLTNQSCTLLLDREPKEIGIIINVLAIDTPDCDDKLEVIPEKAETRTFCGKHVNVTGFSYDMWNQSIKVIWNTTPRESAENNTHGFVLLATAIQKECNENQACFPCLNGHIIDQVHMCNGLNNCGDFSDEFNCPYGWPTLKPSPHSKTTPSPVSSTTPSPVSSTTPSPVPSNSHKGWIIALSIFLFLVVGALLVYGGYWWYKKQNRPRPVPQNDDGGSVP